MLAPAGNPEALSAAIANGADAVYFGVGDLNMRSHATSNFQPEQLPQIVQQCHDAGVKAWLAVNIILHDQELAAVEALLEQAAAAGVDAIIAADPAVMTMSRQRNLPVHVSVQANVSNWQAIAFYAPFADVVVAARELTLEQLQELSQAIHQHQLRGPSGELIRLEAFAHGALCIGISGRCGMSLCQYNTSSNRGKCYQPCRREYTITDVETGHQLQISNRYIMSPKDLCTIAQLPRLLNAGVSVLKLEGRGRSADYVATVTRCYRQALDCWLEDKTPTQEMLQEWLQQLRGVFNRGFWEGGYYLGEKTEIWAESCNSQATRRKELVGTIANYYQKSGVAMVQMRSGELHTGDLVLITGPTTGAVEFTLPEMLVDEKDATTAPAGTAPTFKCPHRVRFNDKVYRIHENPRD